MYELVRVGHDKLVGEIIRLEGDKATIQVFFLNFATVWVIPYLVLRRDQWCISWWSCRTNWFAALCRTWTWYFGINFWWYSGMQLLKLDISTFDLIMTSHTYGQNVANDEWTNIWLFSDLWKISKIWPSQFISPAVSLSMPWTARQNGISDQHLISKQAPESLVVMFMESSLKIPSSNIDSWFHQK